jgi:CO/xanthine dehydrogenase Mo-binding subunit
VGGAFGGKTAQARFVTGAMAVAAKAIKRPVRVAVPRDEDSAMINTTSPFPPTATTINPELKETVISIELESARLSRSVRPSSRT